MDTRQSSSPSASCSFRLANCLAAGTRLLGAPIPQAQLRDDMTFVELGPADREEATSVATEAFLTEPEMITDYCLGPDNSAHGGPEAVGRRWEVVKSAMEWIWSITSNEGRCFGIRSAKTGELLSVAMCMPPGSIRGGHMETPGRLIRNVLRMGAPLALTPKGDARFGCARRRFEQCMAANGRLHARCAPARHWYVQVLATSPKGQGKGLGTTLLESLRAMAAEDGRPVYLETVGQKNRDFYGKRGYEVHAAERVAEGKDSILVYGLVLEQPWKQQY